jgi:hypothetical protein
MAKRIEHHQYLKYARHRACPQVALEKLFCEVLVIVLLCVNLFLDQ